MNLATHLFLRFFALIWLAFGMNIPVSAWTAHNAAHVEAQVSVDEHHHHDDGGDISVHEHDDDEAPDGGHDQMPNIHLGGAAIMDATVVIAAPV